MATSKHTFSGTIAAPIDDVFRILTDPRRIPEWLPACSRVTAPKDTLTKGMRFSFEFETARGRREVAAEVIEFTPPEIIGWSETTPRRNTKTFYRLQFSGSTTKITLQQVDAPSGLFARLREAWFTRRQTARQFERTLQNLRKLLMQ
jgi:uncharacterized protein YndB with AHSA1/START domain